MGQGKSTVVLYCRNTPDAVGEYPTADGPLAILSTNGAPLLAVNTMAMIITSSERSIAAALGSGKSSLDGVTDSLKEIQASLSGKLTSAIFVDAHPRPLVLAAAIRVVHFTGRIRNLVIGVPPLRKLNREKTASMHGAGRLALWDAATYTRHLSVWLA